MDIHDDSNAILCSFTVCAWRTTVFKAEKAKHSQYFISFLKKHLSSLKLLFLAKGNANIFPTNFLFFFPWYPRLLTNLLIHKWTFYMGNRPFSQQKKKECLPLLFRMIVEWTVNSIYFWNKKWCILSFTNPSQTKRFIVGWLWQCRNFIS